MENKISLEEGRNYLLSKPFVEKIDGVYEWLNFTPPTFDNSMTDLDSAQKEIGNSTSENINKRIGLPIGKIFENQEGTYKIALDFDDSRLNKSLDEDILTRVTLIAVPGIADLFESGAYIKKPNLVSGIFLDFRLRQNIAKKLAKEFGLKLDKDCDGIGIYTPQIKKLEDIDPVLEAGIKIAEQVHSEEHKQILNQLREELRRYLF